MNHYEATVKAIKQVLASCGKKEYEAYIDDCISEWDRTRSTELFVKGFKKNGKFEKFAITDTDVSNEEIRFWTIQIFGALVSMAMQLTRFISAGREMPISYMRKNFGHPPEVISGQRCKNCGTKEINSADVDKYITPSVISRAIIDGLEKDCLEKNTAAILDLSSDYLKTERDEAKMRAFNTGVSISDARTPSTVCRKCGCRELDRCRFLKSLKKPVFVALSV